MKKFYSLGALIVVVAMLAACVSTNTVIIGKKKDRPPVPADEVEVYLNADQVPGKYEEVALLNSSGQATWGGESKMVNSMKKKAGKLGANAIIINDIKEPKAIEKIVGEYLGTGSERKGKAIAIYIFPEDEQKKIDKNNPADDPETE